ncbi:MAG TPA: AAA family ATPase, partial [Thermomicrobiales bacterium]|nr:AAA family ATPase [Thermomicrobiales bacterium]
GQLSSDVIGRSGELSALGEFLDAASDHPAAVVIEGEAGIGKTTLWLAALKQAGESGFRVLSARVGQSESALPYAALADLLSGVAPDLLASLPAAQRTSVDRVLLRATNEGPPTGQRIVASALVTLVQALAKEMPVLVAIDDAQWLDQCSLAVLSFAARRFKRRVGLLITERLDAATGSASWLQFARPDAVDRMRIGPLSLGSLHSLISARLGQSLSRPDMVRILEFSGGNPFYALELARARAAASTRSDPMLPTALAELMRRRIGHLDQHAKDVLLAAACVANPTVEILAAATNNTVARITDLLDAPENERVIEIDGNRVRFAHPLLARSVITESEPGRRREIHRALANAIALPELRARHMALATASADAETLRALETAAAYALARGAPAAAAELVELTIELGTDTPLRRIRAAVHHVTSGDVNRARTLLESTIDHMRSGPLRSVALNLLAGVRMCDDAFFDATALLKRALDDAGRHRAMLIQTLMSLSFAQALSGEFDDSVQNARQAVVHAEKHADPDRLSQALALLVATALLNGDDVDRTSLQRALTLEDPDAELSIPICASAVRALVLTTRAELDEVRNIMHTVRLRCIDRGVENAMMPLSCYSALIEIWRGDLAEAAELAQAATEQADQVGGSRAIALTVRGVVAAYVGRESDARADAAAALTIARQSGSAGLAVWPTMSMGFLEVSLGRYAEALSTFQPLLETLDAIPGTQILTAMYIPDAVEAMIALGRDADAEPLI